MRPASALALALALGPAAAAAVPPTTPGVPALPGVVAAGSVLGWTASGFDPAATVPGYHVDLTSPDADAVGDDLPAGATGFPLPTLVNGAAYTLGVRATSGEGDSATATAGPFVYDAQPPMGTVVLNGGATFTASPTVTLSLAASDPLPPVGGGSGAVGGVDIAEQPFPCADPVGCHVPFAALTPFTLAAGGPDGPRVVRVRFYDTAARLPAGSGPDGNVSAPASDDIFLDRVNPTASASAVPGTVRVGAQVTFTSAGSHDDDDNPANDSMLSSNVFWEFGDGEDATGPAVTHAYAAAGTYTATARVLDRAGRSDTDAVAVTVTAAPAPPAGTATAPPVTATGPTTTTPSAARLSGLSAPAGVRAGGALRVRVRLTARATMVLQVVRALPGGGGGAVVRTLRRTTGPGWVTLAVPAPPAGNYRLRVRLGTQVLSRRVVVRAAATSRRS